VSRYIKVGGEYEKLLLFFFHHASDQQLGKQKTADYSTLLSSLLKSPRSLALTAVKDLQSGLEKL